MAISFIHKLVMPKRPSSNEGLSSINPNKLQILKLETRFMIFHCEFISVYKIIIVYSHYKHYNITT